MIDTHCHLTSKRLLERVDDVIQDAHQAGVHGMITVATTTDDAVAALKLAKNHDNIWCSAGVHPLYADEPAETAQDWNVLRVVAADPLCVAWGELGLDNHYDTPLRPKQDALLEDQLSFIQSCRDDGLEKPIIVHCREAFAELLPIFKSTSLPADRFVFHCFTGTPEEAKAVLDFGAMISFTGVVTFANAKDVAAAAKAMPLDRMMIETDAPYLSPEPVRKVFPNEPKHVVHTAAFLAALHGIANDTFADTMDENATCFFGLDVR